MRDGEELAHKKGLALGKMAMAHLRWLKDRTEDNEVLMAIEVTACYDLRVNQARMREATGMTKAQMEFHLVTGRAGYINSYRKRPADYLTGEAMREELAHREALRQQVRRQMKEGN